jgi:hypothetical protein
MSAPLFSATATRGRYEKKQKQAAGTMEVVSGQWSVVS